jgi:threonine dehydratase
MPRYAPEVKKHAVASYDAEIVFCEPSKSSREATVAALMAARESELVHPCDDDNIIAGQGTAALEILAQLDRPADILMTPVGGGGLLSGSAIAVKDHKNRASTLVIGAEPEAADDAWRRFKTGLRVAESTPCTIADSLPGTLGERNFKIIMHRVNDIFFASETRIIEAMRLLWTRLKILVVPSTAVPLAAIMQQPEKFSGKRVVIVLSGGNIDLDALPW